MTWNEKRANFKNVSFSNYKVVTSVLTKCKKYDWTVLNCHFLGFYPIDFDEILDILFASLY